MINGARVAANFKEDCDCDNVELNTVDIPTNVPMKVSDLKELLEHYCNDLDN